VKGAFLPGIIHKWNPERGFEQDCDRLSWRDSWVTLTHRLGLQNTAFDYERPPIIECALDAADACHPKSHVTDYRSLPPSSERHRSAVVISNLLYCISKPNHANSLNPKTTVYGDQALHLRSVAAGSTLNVPSTHVPNTIGHHITDGNEGSTKPTSSRPPAPVALWNRPRYFGGGFSRASGCREHEFTYCSSFRSFERGREFIAIAYLNKGALFPS